MPIFILFFHIMLHVYCASLSLSLSRLKFPFLKNLRKKNIFLKKKKGDRAPFEPPLPYVTLPWNSANPLKTGLVQRQWQSKALLFHRMAEIDLSRDKRIKMKRQTDSLHNHTPCWPVPRWPLLILLSPLTRGLGEGSNGEYTTVCFQSRSDL